MIEIKKYINGELCDNLVAKFTSHQMIYIVRCKRKKIKIIEDKMAGVCFTNIINYKTMNNGYFTDTCNNIFDNKDEAYEYAERLSRRSNIKYKSFY